MDSLNKVEQDIQIKEKTITGIESNQGVPEKVNIGHAIGIEQELALLVVELAGLYLFLFMI